MNYIKNYEQLVNHGCQEERRIALDCLNVALDAASTYHGTKRVVSSDDHALYVGEQIFALDTIDRIYLVGAGKGTYPIVCALNEILGDRIDGGVVALKDFDENPLPTVELIKAAHPVPNEKSLEAGKKIAALGDTLTEKDLVFVCITGGCSSLMVLPPEGILLEDVIQVNKLLMRCGAPIYELNAVRKHICRLKGGGMLKLLAPATVVILTQDTRPEFLPWPDPVLADPSTFADAIKMLKDYDLWEETPLSVQRYLTHGLTHPEMETPKDINFIRSLMYDVGNQRTACETAVQYAQEKGYYAAVLSTKIEGEAREVGSVLAGIAKEIQLYKRPFPTPCVLLSAGETRVTVCEHPGEGGPNQEFALGFAMNIKGYKNVVCASIDSEGTDGPTYIAGGIADESTATRAEMMGLSIFEGLKRHDSSNVLKPLDDAIITIPTGTNVVNLRVLVIKDANE